VNESHELVEAPKRDLATHQPTSDSAALMQIIESTAKNPDFDPQKLRELLQIKREFEGEEARRSFAVHMSRAQATISPVVADADNNQTGSKYAKLVAIVEATKPSYTREGFSVSYGTAESENEKLRDAGYICYKARCLHAEGHFEDYSIELPVDTTGAKGNVNKTVIHGSKSSLTYARGMLLGLIFNFTTSLDVDDDGNGAGPPPRKPAEPASKEQMKELIRLRGEGKLAPETIDYLDNAKEKNLNIPYKAAAKLLFALRKTGDKA